MPDKKKIWRRVLYFFAGFLILLLIGIGYLASVALIDPPVPSDMSSLSLQRVEKNGLFTIGNNWFRKSNSGLYEMYVEGQPFERGVIAGKLAKELVVRQEDHFNEQINKMIPSGFYLRFLKYFIGWFNRNLDENVTEELKEEIYGVSESASSEYNYIGSNYQRILYYHAAHDIGHALQSMALVGCTSFGTWDSRSADSSLIIGRNFDFYVGDKFSEEKIILFVNPDNGYKFMSVTWGGFMGVVSGMNEKGITLTVNAAKSGIPSGSATPVSLVGREILQYAKNIDEAIAIASKRKMFVSESFLIGSASDHKAVLIEKTPDTLEVFDSNEDYIVCTNHFQSKSLSKSRQNAEQMEESSSIYRYEHLMQLLKKNEKNTVGNTVSILRNRNGIDETDIGNGNEKSINQLIAHHSIVFEPEKLLVWVSTAPWQLGPFVAYDLKKVFALHGMKGNKEIVEETSVIPADAFLYTSEYNRFINYRNYKKQLIEGKEIPIDSLIASNPSYYHTYVLAGNYYFNKDEFSKALPFYKKALTMEVATKGEEEMINERVEECWKKSE
jgi:predicted choloylglycine hydrolase